MAKKSGHEVGPQGTTCIVHHGTLTLSTGGGTRRSLKASRLAVATALALVVKNRVIWAFPGAAPGHWGQALAHLKAVKPVTA